MSFLCPSQEVIVISPIQNFGFDFDMNNIIYRKKYEKNILACTFKISTIGFLFVLKVMNLTAIIIPSVSWSLI